MRKASATSASDGWATHGRTDRSFPVIEYRRAGNVRALLSSEEAQRDLFDLRSVAAKSIVAVLCYERDEQRCHRQVIIDRSLRATAPWDSKRRAR